MKIKTITTPVGEAIFVRPSTARGYAMIESFSRTANDSLSDVYKNPSSDKRGAYRDCKDLMESVNGYRFRITGHNCHSFSAGFLYRDSHGYEILCYITKDHLYVLPYMR